MALRRPRFKPTAILKPRNLPSKIIEQNKCLEIEGDTESGIKITTVNVSELVAKNTTESEAEEAKIDDNTKTKVPPASIRRKIKPNVFIPARGNVSATKAETSNLVQKSVIEETEKSKLNKAGPCVTKYPEIKTVSESLKHRKSIEKIPLIEGAESPKLINDLLSSEISSKSIASTTDQDKVPEIIGIEKEAIINDIKPPAKAVIKTTTRRIIKPAICLPIRKKNQEILPANTTESTDLMQLKIEKNALNDNEVVTEVNLKPSDNYFKPPYMSPSLQSSQQKRVDIIYSPISSGHQQDTYLIDDNINSVPSKVRQRIRPTPCFGNRRNSIQGSNSECEDEPNKRQRHVSTSSTHSNYTVNSGLSKPIGLSRIRTESTCSNISDVNSIREVSTKQKKVVRCEGSQKMVNAKKDFFVRFKGKKPDKTRLKMYDLIYYNPLTNPMKIPTFKTIEVKERRSSAVSLGLNQSDATSMPPTPPISIKSEPENKTVMPVPQLKLGPNGEIILDEKSLVIETTGDKEAREILANADIVYDDEFSGTSGFYKRQKRTKDWPAEETIRFYRCLHTIGTDFSLMLTLFPNRSRRDLKLKFKKEERKNLSLINKALLFPKDFDIDELKLEFHEEDLELERKKIEWDEMKAKRAKDKKQALSKKAHKNAISTSTRILADGASIYDYEFVKPPKRKRILRMVNENQHEALITNKTERKSVSISVAQKVADTPSKTDTEIVGNFDYKANNIDENKLPSFNTVLPAHKKRIDESNVAENDNKCPMFYTIDAVPESITNKDLRELNLIPPKRNSVFSDNGLDNCGEKTSDLLFKLNSEDILNMEIIFDNTDNVSSANNFNLSNVNSHSEDIDINNTIYEENVYEEIVDNSENMVIFDSIDMLEDQMNITNMDIYESSGQQTINSIDLDASQNRNVKSKNVIQNTEVVIPQDNRNIPVKQEIDNIIEISEANSDENEDESSDNNDDNRSEHGDDNVFDDNTQDTDDTHQSTIDINNSIDTYDDVKYGLVVVASQDSLDPTKTIHEVFLRSSITGKLSEEPLDLPPDVIERIKSSLAADNLII